MEYILDYVFLGNWTTFAVSCPQELLDKNNNGSDIRKLAMAAFSTYSLLPLIVTDKEKGFFDFMILLLHEYDDSKMYFYYVGTVILSIMLLFNRKRFVSVVMWDDK